MTRRPLGHPIALHHSDPPQEPVYQLLHPPKPPRPVTTPNTCTDPEVRRLRDSLRGDYA